MSDFLTFNFKMYTLQNTFIVDERIVQMEPQTDDVTMRQI